MRGNDQQRSTRGHTLGAAADDRLSPSGVSHLGPRLGRQAQEDADRVGVPFIRGLRLGDFLRAVLQRGGDAHVSAFAGHLAFRALFAIFPSLISFVWLLQALHVKVLSAALAGLTATALPAPASAIVHQQLSALPRGHASTSLTPSVAVSLVAAIWALSETFRATMEAMNVIYQEREQRPLLWRYLLSFLLAAVVGLLLTAALGLLTFGSQLAGRAARAIGLGPALHWLGLGITWLALSALVVAAFELVYYVAPHGKRRFHWASWGSVVALLLWLVFTSLYTLYTNHLVAYTETYGALAGIAVLMIYLYAVALILLLGAVMNRVVEDRQPPQH